MLSLFSRFVVLKSNRSKSHSRFKLNTISVHRSELSPNFWVVSSCRFLLACQNNLWSHSVFPLCPYQCIGHSAHYKMLNVVYIQNQNNAMFESQKRSSSRIFFRANMFSFSDRNFWSSYIIFILMVALFSFGRVVIGDKWKNILIL